jgi:halimadienyl-diphosphate synthase
MQTAVLQLAEPVRNLDEGQMNGVAYDTAWVARVRDKQGTPLFPECIKWLLENQKPDGSWGSHVNHAQDRVLSTLVAIISLAEIDSKRFEPYIRRGESYIWNHIDELGSEYRRLAGIELILPTLMEEAEKLNLNLPFHKKKYEEERRRKLEKVDKSLWYFKSTTLPYSLEFLGDDFDREKAAGLLSENGSVFNSPSTTAYVLMHTRMHKAYEYLRRTLMQTGDGSIMTVHPFEIFENSWMIYNFMLGGIDAPNVYAKYCSYFLNCMTPRGVGASVYFPLPDADDTAVVAKVLAKNGIFISPSILEPYYMKGHFVTYGFEETESSVTTNIHILDFLKDYGNFSRSQEIKEHILQFLRKEMKCPGYWIDKWHASIYYPTSHAVIALSHIDNVLASKAVSWILETQNENGMWGYEGGSIEETTYAVQALLYYHMHVERIDLEPVAKAMPHICVVNMKECPEFWVAKGLYVPTNILTSAIASALNMYKTAAKRSIPMIAIGGI